MTTEAPTARVDLYARVTDEIVKAIEAGAGKFIMPWHGGAAMRPRNAIAGDAYHGINTLVLWASARNRGFASPLWATFLQWREVDAKVRKGEHGTTIVLYKKVAVEAEDTKTGEPVEDHRWIIRPYTVFNAAQVENWTEPEAATTNLVATHEEIENFIAATGADIRQGDTAFYHRAGDYISIPYQRRFTGTLTSTPTETYYSTVFHELVHWTGHWMRLNRNLTSRFGTADYAMEELIAELGAAFLCAEFFVVQMPRTDHAAYIGEWLDVLKKDKRAIFEAARKSNDAIGFLLSN